jgi:hypothetical protein
VYLLITTIIILACIPGTIAVSQQPTEAPPTQEREPVSGAVYEIPTQNPPQCARVTAYSLNMRATPNGTVIHWLYQDQTVTVMDSTGKWWKISAYNTTGYAHSTYMEIVKCR